eukprot:TRINITY_DN8479_c0_g3_i3.p1 TRINITY_DN8479_c0_g3~~TRINITY_DN8479_c0_g3_i3.p1  ORF type:complete len:173 (-),score=35.29 TRINITY_DN8479_c0_g3_i3:269-787(-)
MEHIFFGFLETKKDIEILSAHAIFNETLLNSFLSQYRILANRSNQNPQLFSRFDWTNTENAELRKNTIDFCNTRAQYFPWNEKSAVYILPALHGTEFGVAMSIAANGFAVLSSLWMQDGMEKEFILQPLPNIVKSILKEKRILVLLFHLQFWEMFFLFVKIHLEHLLIWVFH